VSEQETILIQTTDGTVRRGGSRPREFQVEVLARNVHLFLNQVDSILDTVPEDVGKDRFTLTEFTVSAQISAKGALVLMGTGVEAEGSGGLTFKFERKQK
jgi:hypothetical protein